MSRPAPLDVHARGLCNLCLRTEAACRPTSLLPASTSLSRSCWPRAAVQGFPGAAKTDPRFRPQGPFGGRASRNVTSTTSGLEPRVPSNRLLIAAGPAIVRHPGGGERCGACEPIRSVGSHPPPSHRPRAGRRAAAVRRGRAVVRRPAGGCGVRCVRLAGCHWAPRSCGDGTVRCWGPARPWRARWCGRRRTMSGARISGTTS